MIEVKSTYAKKYLSKLYKTDNFNVVSDVKEIDWDSSKLQLCMPNYYIGKGNFKAEEYSKTIGKTSSSLPFERSSTSVAYDIDYIYRNIKDENLIALMIPNSDLFIRDKLFNPAKEELIFSGYIKEIVQLPWEKLLFTQGFKEVDSRKVFSTLIVFSKNNKDVKMYEQELCERNSETYYSFKFDEIRELNFYILPSYCITKKIFANYEVRLSDIADVQIGCNTIRFTKAIDESLEKSETNKIYPVNLKDINNTAIATEIDPVYVKDKSKFRNTKLLPGDIVFPSKGALFKSAMVDQNDNRELVATSNLFIIRPKSGVVPEFILAYLNSSMFDYYIYHICAYSYFSAVRVGDLQDAPIALNYEEYKKSEEKINSSYVKFRKTYGDLLRQIHDLEDYQKSEISHIFIDF